MDTHVLKDVFDTAIHAGWMEPVDIAKVVSVLCFGAARNSLDGLSLNDLKSTEYNILTYRRVAVARIAVEIQKELLDADKQKVTQ